MLLVHRRDVIEPVEVRQRLQVGLVLDQLLGAAVQEPDVGINALDHLAVENTRRKTPCAAGCWGPKLMVNLR
jgi:hypothetical protein